MSRKGIIIARISAFAAGAGMLIAGIAGGEPAAVLQKAVKVCLECIGIG